MGFFSGRVSYLRFRVDGPSPGIFGPDHLVKLSSDIRIGVLDLNRLD